MQLPREGVEALSVARLAGDEPEGLRGQPRPGGPASMGATGRCAPSCYGLLVLPVISPP